MRLSLATGIGVALAASLIAGCSGTSQGTSALPGGTSVGSQSATRGGPITPDSKGQKRFMELLKLQAEGKLKGAVPQKSAERAYKYLLKHPNAPLFKISRDGGSPKLWVSNTDYSFLLGQNKKGTKTIDAIDTANNGCYEPITVKTDSSGNIYTACGETSSGGGAEQEYNASGTGSGTQYAWSAPSCPPSALFCEGSGFDGGPDGLGHVYSELSVNEQLVCIYEGPYYCYEYEYEYGTPGFYWWNANSPSSSPTFIPVTGTGSNPVSLVYYMATDSSGNIYFDYCAFNSYGECTFGLAEITNPTTSPTFVPLLAPGFLEFAGGVEINGNTLSVTDQETRYTYQYHLPITASSSPFRTLGPTAVGLGGYGDPVSGGLNSNGSMLVQGDAEGWLDVTKVSNNHQTNAVTIDDLPSTEGAAYTP
jgi:hypothetical protein